MWRYKYINLRREACTAAQNVPFMYALCLTLSAVFYILVIVLEFVIDFC